MKHISPREELQARVTAAGSQKRAADDLGISQQYVNDLLAGRRTFSKAILEKLGLHAITIVKRRTA